MYILNLFVESGQRVSVLHILAIVNVLLCTSIVYKCCLVPVFQLFRVYTQECNC